MNTVPKLAGNSKLPDFGAPAESVSGEGEVWREIVGFSDYEVSSYGRVRNTRTGLIKRSTERATGGQVTSLSSQGVKRTLSLHTLVAKAFLGPCSSGCRVVHLDGDRSNNSIANIAYRPRAIDLRTLEASPPSNDGRRGKIMPRQAEQIRTRARAGEPGVWLAREFGITPAAVSQIKNGKRWKR